MKTSQTKKYTRLIRFFKRYLFNNLIISVLKTKSYKRKFSFVGQIIDNKEMIKNKTENLN
jgi:hypothetical protein